MPEFTYRFSIGNTNRKGQVGLCFSIELRSKVEDRAGAVLAARKFFNDLNCPEEPIRVPCDLPHTLMYVKPSNITEDDIVDVYQE